MRDITPRERIIEATNHRITDQLPIDFGAMRSTGISAIAYPQRFHVLMSKATDAFVMFAKRQIENVGDLLVRTNLWDWDWAPDVLMHFLLKMNCASALRTLSESGSNVQNTV